MRRWTVPLIDKSLILYVGPGEYQKWYRAVKAHGADVAGECHADAKGGRTWGTWVWVEKPTVELLAHELSHWVAGAMEDLGSECEELRAHITGWVTDRVFKYYTESNGFLPS